MRSKKCAIVIGSVFGMSKVSVRISREVIDEYRLPRSLLVNGYNDLFPQMSDQPLRYTVQAAHALCSKREIRQVELILDIERRDRAIVTELCNTLDSNDANAVRAPILIGEINTAE